MANGSEKFTIELDLSKIEKQAEEASHIISNVGKTAEKSGEELDDAFSGKSTKGLSKSAKEAEDAISKVGKTTEQVSKQMNDAMGENSSLRMQLRVVANELGETTIKYRSMSDAEKQSASGQELKKKMDELTQKAGVLRDTMDDVNEAIKNTASDTSNWDALGQGLNLVTSSVGAATGAFEMLGMSEEDVQDVQAKLQASLAISNALTVAQNALQSQSALVLGVRRVQEAAAATAITIKTAAEGKGIIVTKAATIAQAAFNAVAKANPYVLLAAAVLSVVGAFVLFSKGAKEATKNEKQLNEEHERQKKYLEELGHSTAGMEASFHQLQNKWKQLRTESEKNKFIKDNAKAFDTLGLKVRSTAEAESVLVKNTQAVIQSFRLRAQAMAAQNAAVSAYEKYYDKLNRKTRQTGDYYTPYKKGEISDEEAIAAGVRTTRERQSLSYEQGEGRMKVNDYTADEVAKINAYRQKQAYERRKQYEKDAKDDLNAVLDVYDKAQAEAEEKLAKYDFLLGSGESNSQKEKSGGGGGKTTTSTKAQEAYVQAGKDLGQKYAEAQSQAIIDAMPEGEEKVLAQLELQHKKESDQIEKDKADLLKKKMEAVAERGGDATNVTLDENEESLFTNRAKVAQEAYDNLVAKTKEESRKAQAEQMNQFLAQYGTYAQQMQAIAALYEQQMEGKSQGEKNTLAAQMLNEIQSVQQQYRESLQSMSTESIQSMLNGLNAVLEANKGAFSQSTLDSYKMQIESLSNEIASRNPFTEMKAAADELKIAEDEVKTKVEELTAAQSNTIQAQANLDTINSGGSVQNADGTLKTQAEAETELANAKARETEANIALNTALQKEANTRARLKKAQNDSVAACRKLISALNGVGDAIGGTAGDIINIVATIGSTVTSAIEGMKVAAEAGATAIATVEKASVILAIISAAIQIATKIANLLIAAHDGALQDDIDRLQKQIDSLQDSYKALEKVVEKTFSKVKENNISQQIANQRQQIILINRQIADEQKKKKTDKDKIDDYKDKIKELQENIKDLAEEAKNAIFGEDITTAIENFADAYVEAWSNGESKVKSAKSTVKDMMRSMVTESIKSAIQASNSMEMIREKLREFYSDNVLTGWEQDYIYGMANALQEEIDKEFGWADRLMKDSSDSQTSSAGGFAAASQDSVDELNGRFTAIQMTTTQIDDKLSTIVGINAASSDHLQYIRLQTEQSVNLAQEAVNQLGAIEKNTRELYTMNERLDRIEQNTRSL